jgi:hypothetical protein
MDHASRLEILLHIWHTDICSRILSIYSTVHNSYFISTKVYPFARTLSLYFIHCKRASNLADVLFLDFILYPTLWLVLLLGKYSSSCSSLDTYKDFYTCTINVYIYNQLRLPSYKYISYFIYMNKALSIFLQKLGYFFKVDVSNLPSYIQTMFSDVHTTMYIT